MAPPTKKRKTDSNAVRYKCFSCDTERISKQFPDYNPSPDCDHLINTCKICLKKWIETNVQSGNFITAGEDDEVWGINCPHPKCDGIMRNVNVEEAATKKVYARFDELERNHIAETTPDWRWCLAPGCRSGQTHIAKVVEPGKKKTPHFGKMPPRPVNDIFTCSDCGAQACVPCDRPWHEGETCEQYQARTQGRFEEEDQALKKIRQISKECPGCGKRIEKNGGCPSMVCSACGVNFCWNCVQIPDKRGCGCNRRY